MPRPLAPIKWRRVIEWAFEGMGLPDGQYPRRKCVPGSKPFLDWARKNQAAFYREFVARLVNTEPEQVATPNVKVAIGLEEEERFAKLFGALPMEPSCNTMLQLDSTSADRKAT
jgi:hypothetical protein